jgi:DNA-binding CsgD family transcriptional regulator
MIIWMKVTNDEYELPIAIADSRSKLARKLGIKPNTIATAIHRAKKDGSRQQFVEVVIDDDDE